MLYKVLMILFIITLNHCYATDKTKYIDEYSARQRLYLITILKCNISGGTSKNNVDVFAFANAEGFCVIFPRLTL